MATAALVDPPAGALTPAQFVVSSRERDTADTWTLTLEPLSGTYLTVAPGQFVMIYAFGIGEVPISVSGPPLRPGPVVLTVRDVGAVTHAVCTSLPGTTLGVRGPFGTAWPIDAAAGDDIVVIAGGIGLAPLRPVVMRAIEHRDRYGTITVLYGARTPADLLYPAQLEQWRRDITVAVTVDAADSGWAGRVGVVPKLVSGAGFAPDATTAFVCGPEIMMHFAIAALLERGLEPEQIIVSMERDMRCGVGLCGHCQLGPTLICRDGPVYSYAELEPWLGVREL